MSQEFFHGHKIVTAARQPRGERMPEVCQVIPGSRRVCARLSNREKDGFIGVKMTGTNGTPLTRPNP